VKTAALRLAAVALIAAAVAACGKKGPPLAPLRLVPAAASEPTARRSATEVELHFGLPSANANGPGPVDLTKVEIYAVTVAPGAIMPPNRDFLVAANVVGSIAVKPPPVEGEDTSSDKRPGPGDRIAFVEELTETKLKPTPGVGTKMPVVAPAKTPGIASETPPTSGEKPDVPGQNPVVPGQKPEAVENPTAGQKPDVVPTPAAAQKPEPGQKPDVAAQKPEAGAQPAEAGAAPTPAAAAAQTTPALAVVEGLPEASVPSATGPTRIYAIRGISRAGRPGLPSARLVVPLFDPAAAPFPVTVRMPAEGVLAVEWMPPVADFGSLPLRFNVYRGDAAAPMNGSPIAGVLFQIPSGEYGKEMCFAVRTVQTAGPITIESAPSPSTCLTLADTFPPAAPKGLRAVAEDGAVNLVWEANTEPDLAGYLVLRGDASGGTLQPITAQPVKDASFRDAGIKPGVRYMYAVVAVDNATPRNASAQSAPEAVTSR
jgi:predicted small lipoprotein YifL